MNLKKVMALGIAASMFMSSSAAAITSTTSTTSADNFRKALQEQRERLMVLESQLSAEENLQELKDADTVRVIVEVEGDAVIEKATAKGLKVSEMSISEVEGIQQQILNDQITVQDQISSQGVNFDIINTFTNVTNGFSMETTLGEAKKIEAIDGVRSVTIANEYDRPEPDMNNSGDITEVYEAWTNGFDGEGTVISIIDTGIDSDHKDMLLTHKNKAELDKTEVEGIVSDEGLPGKFYTDKVPYGYNYMDENAEIRDLGPDASMHGMHVAGIAGANGDKEAGGIKGTAPEAQLLAMKVFGNNPAMSSTFGDVIIKAIDDSVILGADVINMSLGSTSSFVDDEDPEQAAVNRAVDNGVVVAVSAGNSNVFGSGYDNPLAQNPDYGVVGSPGLATDSLQVASIENNIMTGYGVEFNIDGKDYIYPYTTSGEDILENFKGKELKVVDCGLGGLPEHFPAAVKGNIALIQRGSYDFTSKIANAEKYGAVAVIVYNSTAGGDGLINMMYPDGGKIPAMFMGLTGGKLIKENSKKDGFTISMNGNSAEAANPVVGKMADSTSWGFTPDLEFKPEITGVGGNVWSTANDNGYQNMSGTSMAAPNVAGGSALVLQRVDDLFELTGEAKALMAKNILMSTAIPHVDKGDNQSQTAKVGANYTSPRRQGAGVMNLSGATKTPAIVTDKTTGISKVNLKEIKGDKATFTITVENFGKDEVSYDLEGTVQTDFVQSEYTNLEADNIIDKNTKKFPISFSNKTVKVAADSSADVTVTVDLSNAVIGSSNKTIEKAFKNGGYIEGFVTLTDPTDTNPELSIPYAGFKGEWDKVPVIDDSIYDEDGISYYGVTSLVDQGLNFYGFDYGADQAKDMPSAEYIDMSPDKDGYVDSVRPVVSYLRNAKNVEIEILDAEGNVLRTLYKKNDVRKHYYDGGKTRKYSILSDAEWDGTVNGKLVEEGSYTYRIKTKVDFEDAEWQNNDYKVNVDLTAPEVKGAAYDAEKKTLTLKGEDNFDGHVYAYLLVTPLGTYTSKDGVFDISAEVEAGYNMRNFTAAVSDYAQNIGIEDLSNLMGPVEGDKDAPVVKLTSPEFFATYNGNNINFAGTVTDKSSVEVVKIAGQDVPLTYDSAADCWKFSVDMTLENGYHSIKVYSKDNAGNEIEFAHKLFVDGEAPVIDIAELPAQTIDNSVVLSGKATDNFPNLKVVVNGNVIANIEQEFSYFDQLDPASYDFNNYEIALEDGENTIVVEVTDAAGHKTTKQVTVNKVDEIVDDVAPLAPIVELVDGKVVIKPADEDTVKIQYSYDKETWNDYTEDVVFEENATLYVIAVDAAGNKSVVVEYTVPDTTKPGKPVMTEENGNVTITKADEDTAKIEYSLDNETWIEYKESVQVPEKGTIYARATDQAGNVSEVADLTVPDRTAPKAPTMSQKDGLVTIKASDDDTVKIEYSLDNETWTVYTEPVQVAENATVYVRAIDDAGNISEVKEIKVPSTIDPSEPVTPEKPADTTPPSAPVISEKDGVVTIVASDDDTAKLEYTLDGKIWVPYKEPVKVAEKATIQARAIDEATNISDVVDLTVPDRTAPKAPKMSAKNNMVTIEAQDEDVVKIEYSLDNKETWIEYKDPVKLATKKTMYARVTDEAGNISEISKLTMPSSGNSLPQTGGLVGSGLMAVGGVAVAAFGALMLKKRNRK